MNSLAMLRPQPTPRQLLTAARGRVFTRLDSAINFPIVVVSAPAGFGKSTVLREFLSARRIPHRRVALRPNHADLSSLMRSLAMSVSDLAPSLLTSFLGVYQRVNAAPDVARQVAAWAAEHLGSVAVTIVIDGLEHALDARVAGAVSEIIDRTAGLPVRWIVVARSQLAFPGARWLADERMDLPIDEIDLALTAGDFAAVVGDDATLGERVRTACEDAAHWPAAVALQLSDERALGDGSVNPLPQRWYGTYAARAFNARPEIEQRFLLETCFFPSFDAAALAIAGWRDNDAIVAALCEAGAFIYIDGDGTYRYHDVFREFLQELLRSKASGLAGRIARATADVCRRVGRPTTALELFIELQESTELATLLSERGFELLDRGESDVVYRAVGALDEAHFASYPVALALKASLESLYGSFDLAEAWFRHAIKMVTDETARGAIVFRFATDLVRRDRRDAIELLQPVVEAGSSDIGLAVSLAGLLATAYATQHQDEAAARTIERAIAQLPAIDDTTIHAKLYFQAGYVALFARDFGLAKRYAERARSTALAAHLYDIAARALSILYNVAMDYEDDIPASRRHLEELASCSMKAGSRHLLMYAILARYEIEVLSGNAVESVRLDGVLKSLEVDYSVVATETLVPAQALRATWSGDFHRAYRLVAPTAEKQITPIRRAQRFAEIALYAAAAGLRNEALVAARRALATIPRSAPLDTSTIFTRAYVALALTVLGYRRRALLMLRRIARHAPLTPRFRRMIAALGLVNERWSRGRYSSDLRAMLDALDEADFGGIARLIEALPLPETYRWQFSSLTEGEREVLVLLAAGLVPAEIATRLALPLETVDAWIVTVCRKLGCTSSRHAVALAQSTGALRDGGIRAR